MTRIRVCSGWSPRGRKEYGEKFLWSFDPNWPAEVELAVYVEEPEPMPRNACRDLWSIPGAREFDERHRKNRDAQGLVPHPKWKESEVRRGYSFRHDAYKFWKQILIPAAATADMADGDILIWLDGDVVTRRPLEVRFLHQLMGEADVVYLGRGRSHSEIGFWMVRLSPKVRTFLADIATFYTSDAVFNLQEWHSAFVWDTVREWSGLVEKNLCRPGAHGHVFPDTILSSYLRHDKGPRKGIAR